MPLPIANTTFDVGVTRDPVADTKANVENQLLVTDIGVPHSFDGIDANPRDLPSMTVSRTRKDLDGPTPRNPKTGNTNYYQR